MDWLDGSSIVPDKGHKLVDLGLGDRNLVSHHDPLDPLRARGRSERAMISKMVKVVRNQRGKIELARGSRLACVLWQGRPEGQYHRMARAQIGEERHDDDVAGSVAMYEMEFKGGGPSFDMVFARFVEMKLHQSIGSSTHM